MADDHPFTRRHLEALEILAGMRAGAGAAKAATMEVIDKVYSDLASKIFAWEDKENGRWLRINVGRDRYLQLCWHSLITNNTEDTRWTFPKPFADTKMIVVVNPAYQTSSNAQRNIIQRRPSLTHVDFTTTDKDDLRAAVGVTVFALGLGLKPSATTQQVEASTRRLSTHNSSWLRGSNTPI